eukprot:6209534-Pleurochrysis_carterae.AAC.2
MKIIDIVVVVSINQFIQYRIRSAAEQLCCTSSKYGSSMAALLAPRRLVRGACGQIAEAPYPRFAGGIL